MAHWSGSEWSVENYKILILVIVKGDFQLSVEINLLLQWLYFLYSMIGQKSLKNLHRQFNHSDAKLP